MNSARIMNLGRAFAVVAIVVIVAAGAVLQPGADNVSDILRYAGRFHILALHVPIGVLVLALMAEPLTLLKKYRRTGDLIVGFALPMLVLTGFAAILLGLSLAHGGDYPHKLVARHRNLTSAGLIFAALATIAWPYRKRIGRWPHRALLGLGALLISVGAHFGGSLTHGADYLFAPLEPKAKATEVVPDSAAPADDAGAPADDAGAPPSVTNAGGVGVGDPADAGIVDASIPREASAPAPKAGPKQIVQAMFGRRCAPCHTTNSKGGLRLSTDPSKMKAAEITAGNPGSSRIYERLQLPIDDEYHMPPQKEAQPSKGEIAAVKQWITGMGPAP